MLLSIPALARVMLGGQLECELYGQHRGASFLNVRQCHFAQGYREQCIQFLYPSLLPNLEKLSAILSHYPDADTVQDCHCSVVRKRQPTLELP
jgi:hypothetical protein